MDDSLRITLCCWPPAHSWLTKHLGAHNAEDQPTPRPHALDPAKLRGGRFRVFRAPSGRPSAFRACPPVFSKLPEPEPATCRFNDTTRLEQARSPIAFHVIGRSGFRCSAIISAAVGSPPVPVPDPLCRYSWLGLSALWRVTGELGCRLGLADIVWPVFFELSGRNRSCSVSAPRSSLHRSGIGLFGPATCSCLVLRIALQPYSVTPRSLFRDTVQLVKLYARIRTVYAAFRTESARSAENTVFLRTRKCFEKYILICGTER